MTMTNQLSIFIISFICQTETGSAHLREVFYDVNLKIINSGLRSRSRSGLLNYYVFSILLKNLLSHYIDISSSLGLIRCAIFGNIDSVGVESNTHCTVSIERAASQYFLCFLIYPLGHRSFQFFNEIYQQYLECTLLLPVQYLFLLLLSYDLHHSITRPTPGPFY